jgi:transmembrane sensor
MPSSLVVTAGFRVTFSIDGRSAVVPLVEKVDEPAIRESLAWQAPRLVFVDTPLADVVAQFNRHNRLQITLGDASLMARPVGGNFRADNVETFVSLLERSRDIVVERPSPDRVILHRAR